MVAVSEWAVQVMAALVVLLGIADACLVALLVIEWIRGRK